MHTIKYPELLTMKSDEVFIEWAYVMYKFKLKQKLPLKKIIAKNELNDFVKGLKELHEGDEIELVTISK